MIGLWCNGSTTGFGSVCPGSNPGSPTQRALQRKLWGSLCVIFLFKMAFSCFIFREILDLQP